MNTIILTKNYEKYPIPYHWDIIRAFMKKSKCYLYGEGYPQYSPSDTIKDVIVKSPFNTESVDLIMVSTTWEIQNENIKESDPHPRLNLSSIDVPKVFFLNKEYKKLEQKLDYAKRNEFDLVCTVHHSFRAWAKQTGLTFARLPFAADPDCFKVFNSPKTYDFGFTGNLHRKHLDIRYEIKRNLFRNPDAKSLGLSLFLETSPFKLSFSKGNLKKEFEQFKIYWAEWGTYSILGKSLVPTGTHYPKFLGSFKNFLSTPSALGIINTRFFECMAVKTLIFCPESEYYQDMFKDGSNCVMFKQDLSDFTEKLHQILSDDEKRETIINNAYNDFISNHTYVHRVETVLNFFGLDCATTT